MAQRMWQIDADKCDNINSILCSVSSHTLFFLLSRTVTKQLHETADNVDIVNTFERRRGLGSQLTRCKYYSTQVHLASVFIFLSGTRLTPASGFVICSVMR